MKSFLAPITKWLTRLSEYLITFGAFGLFIVALLDSTFVPLPSSVDALMLLLSTTYPNWMLLYAFMATSGSALGCLILYLISRRAGARALNRFSERKQARVKNLIERFDMMAVLVATLLPPPFPFKLFVVSAGVFRFSLVRFMLAIIVGRGFRFLLEGYFAVRYGAEAKEILAKYYPWIGLGLAAGILLYVLLKQRSLFTRANPVQTESSSHPQDL
ncbi:MAG TPA: VTT domain-containing protein [Pyrinomonadaceae bacterium]|nr:VTT domain-containing protein [Pyrinomonadaceae bacterium]